MNLKASEKAAPLDKRIRLALGEDPVPPSDALVAAGVELSDDDFLKQAEQARVEVGDQIFVPFWGRIEIRWDFLENNEAVAHEIASMAEGMARCVARYNALKGKG